MARRRGAGIPRRSNRPSARHSAWARDGNTRYRALSPNDGYRYHFAIVPGGQVDGSESSLAADSLALRSSSAPESPSGTKNTVRSRLCFKRRAPICWSHSGKLATTRSRRSTLACSASRHRNSPASISTGCAAMCCSSVVSRAPNSPAIVTRAPPFGACGIRCVRTRLDSIGSRPLGASPEPATNFARKGTRGPKQSREGRCFTLDRRALRKRQYVSSQAGAGVRRDRAHRSARRACFDIDPRHRHRHRRRRDPWVSIVSRKGQSREANSTQRELFACVHISPFTLLANEERYAADIGGCGAQSLRTDGARVLHP